MFQDLPQSETIFLRCINTSPHFGSQQPVRCETGKSILGLIYLYTIILWLLFNSSSVGGHLWLMTLLAAVISSSWLLATACKVEDTRRCLQAEQSSWAVSSVVCFMILIQETSPGSTNGKLDDLAGSPSYNSSARLQWTLIKISFFFRDQTLDKCLAATKINIISNHQSQTDFIEHIKISTKTHLILTFLTRFHKILE